MSCGCNYIQDTAGIGFPDSWGMQGQKKSLARVNVAPLLATQALRNIAHIVIIFILNIQKLNEIFIFDF